MSGVLEDAWKNILAIDGAVSGISIVVALLYMVTSKDYEGASQTLIGIIPGIIIFDALIGPLVLTILATIDGFLK